MLKKPKKFTGKLISKNEDIIDDKKIFVMIFKTNKDKSKKFDLVPDVYKCYSYEDYNLILNENYDIFIKEFNWKIVSISRNISNDIIDVKNSTLLPIFIAIEFILLFVVFLGVLGLVYFKENKVLCFILINIFGIASVYIFIKYILFERNNKND